MLILIKSNPWRAVHTSGVAKYLAKDLTWKHGLLTNKANSFREVMGRVKSKYTISDVLPKPRGQTIRRLECQPK